MTEIVQWCSLYCEGNPAVGMLEIIEHNVSMPVCEKCLKIEMDKLNIKDYNTNKSWEA